MKRRIVLASAALCVVVAIVGTYAWARSQAAGQLNACVANSDGAVRIVAEGVQCKNNESPITWNAQGPAGSVGPAGPAGRYGRDGQQGPPGPAGASAANPDGADATMSVTGQKQGSFSASPMILIGLSHAIVSPRDAASGLPTGKRQHKPLVITKQIDKATPLLLNALVTNENLTQVVITLRQGGQAVSTIKLTNASIAERQQHGLTESISFTYQKIEWTWLDGGVTATDDWESPVA
jgi:type VI secretion system secreted protein Hcp